MNDSRAVCVHDEFNLNVQFWKICILYGENLLQEKKVNRIHTNLIWSTYLWVVVVLSIGSGPMEIFSSFFVDFSAALTFPSVLLDHGYSL